MQRLMAGAGLRLCGIFRQDVFKSCGQKFRVSFRNYQRRPQLDDIVMRPIGAGKNAAFAQPVDHVRRLQWSGRASVAIQHQIKA